MSQAGDTRPVEVRHDLAHVPLAPPSRTSGVLEVFRRRYLLRLMVRQFTYPRWWVGSGLEATLTAYATQYRRGSWRSRSFGAAAPGYRPGVARDDFKGHEAGGTG